MKITEVLHACTAIFNNEFSDAWHTISPEFDVYLEVHAISIGKVLHASALRPTCLSFTRVHFNYDVMIDDTQLNEN